MWVFIKLVFDLQAWRTCRPLWFRVPRSFRIVWIAVLLLLGPFRRRWHFDPRQIRALLLVRDLYSSLPFIVNDLLGQGLIAEHILLIDSGSSNPACLQVLSNLQERGCRWVRLQSDDHQYGPYACWMSFDLTREIRSWRYPYIVTDTDLELPKSLPLNWLSHLFETINCHRGVAKSSLPLQIVDIDVDNKSAIQAHELSLSQRIIYRICSCLFLGNSTSAAVCSTDTTLSLYRPSPFYSTFSIRLPLIYCIRHLPWYSEYAKSAEYKYYQAHKLSLFGDWS